MKTDTQNRPLFVERGSCPLCNSINRKVHLPFAEIPVVRCNKCGFIYSSCVMSDEAMMFYYKNTFSGNRHIQGQRVNATINLAALERLLDLRKVKSYLDVGTGYGFLLKAIETKYGIPTKGVELSQKEAQYGINTLKVDVLPVLLAESELPNSSFDVVSCFEVIEHINNPVKFIAEMAQYVRAGGMMIVMTDNFTSKIVTKLGAEFPKWIPHCHISYFSPETLVRCIDSVPGLKIERQLSYTPWELIVRSLIMMGRASKPPEQAYSLENSIKTEMGGTYKFFMLRLLLNSIWAKCTFQNNLEGALMFTLIRKE